MVAPLVAPRRLSTGLFAQLGGASAKHLGVPALIGRVPDEVPAQLVVDDTGDRELEVLASVGFGLGETLKREMASNRVVPDRPVATQGEAVCEAHEGSGQAEE